MNIQLFTHTDLDGIGCEVLSRLAYGDTNVSVTYCDYDNVDNNVRNFLYSGISVDEIHITDISISDDLAKEIDDSGVVCKLFDHHITASYLNKYDWCVVEESLSLTKLKTSGTELYFLYLMDQGLGSRLRIWNRVASANRFVEIVRNWDTWRWSSMGEGGEISKKMNDLFHLYGKKSFADICISRIMEGEFPKLSVTDEIVLTMENKKIDDYVSLKNNQLIIKPLFGKLCGFVFADKYFSELGNRLCTLNPLVDFVAMIDIGNCSISYRTVKDDINLGEDIAKPLGGGGHPKSAGSTFPKDVRSEIIDLLFNDRDGVL